MSISSGGLLGEEGDEVDSVLSLSPLGGCVVVVDVVGTVCVPVLLSGK